MLAQIGACWAAALAVPDRLASSPIGHSSAEAAPRAPIGVTMLATMVAVRSVVVLEGVSARFPDFRLVPGTNLEFAPNITFRSPLSLPVEWGPESLRS